MEKNSPKNELRKLKSLVRKFLKATENVPFRAVDCDQNEVKRIWIKLLTASTPQPRKN